MRSRSSVRRILDDVLLALDEIVDLRRSLAQFLVAAVLRLLGPFRVLVGQLVLTIERVLERFDEFLEVLSFRTGELLRLLTDLPLRVAEVAEVLEGVPNLIELAFELVEVLLIEQQLIDGLKILDELLLLLDDLEIPLAASCEGALPCVLPDRGR